MSKVFTRCQDFLLSFELKWFEYSNVKSSAHISPKQDFLKLICLRYILILYIQNMFMKLELSILWLKFFIDFLFPNLNYVLGVPV